MTTKSDALRREQTFAKVDLLTAELELEGSIYKGFSTAIMVKGQPRTVGLFREYDDAVQMMALIEQARQAAAPSVQPDREVIARIQQMIVDCEADPDGPLMLAASVAKEHADDLRALLAALTVQKEEGK